MIQSSGSSFFFQGSSIEQQTGKRRDESFAVGLNEMYAIFFAERDWNGTTTNQYRDTEWENCDVVIMGSQWNRKELQQNGRVEG